MNDAALAAIAWHWGQVLAEVSVDRQPILLLDACSAHLGPKFLATCRSWRIWVVCVPARLTWLMKPADTHCFALLKAWLRQRFHEALLAGTDGKSQGIGLLAVFQLVNGATPRWQNGAQAESRGSTMAWLQPLANKHVVSLCSCRLSMMVLFLFGLATSARYVAVSCVQCFCHVYVVFISSCVLTWLFCMRGSSCIGVQWFRHVHAAGP